MALSGIHVVCSTAGENDNLDRSFVPLMNGVYWSQNLTSAGRTTQSAPRPTTRTGIKVALPVMHIVAGVDAWISFGNNSVVATADPRVFLAAGETLDILVQPGTFVAYSPA